MAGITDDDITWALAEAEEPARVRACAAAGAGARFLPELIELIWNRQIDPGGSSTSASRLSRPPRGYKAMDQRRAIKTPLTP